MSQTCIHHISVEWCCLVIKVILHKEQHSKPCKGWKEWLAQEWAEIQIRPRLARLISLDSIRTKDWELRLIIALYSLFVHQHHFCLPFFKHHIIQMDTISQLQKKSRKSTWGKEFWKFQAQLCFMCKICLSCRHDIFPFSKTNTRLNHHQQKHN